MLSQQVRTVISEGNLALTSTSPRDERCQHAHVTGHMHISQSSPSRFMARKRVVADFRVNALCHWHDVRLIIGKHWCMKGFKS